MESSKNKADRERTLWIGVAEAVAHDMGTPLSAIMGWLEFLPSSEDPAQIAEEINYNLNRLSLLSERLSQIRPPAKIEAIALEEIFSDIKSHFKERLPSGGPEIMISDEVKRAPFVQANRTLLSWVLENLVKNSVEALLQKGGEIILSASQQGSQVTMDISDNAQGISPELQRDIFRPGFTTKRSGRGIGLPLSKYIIEDIHGGEIFLKESHPGQGTTMRIILKAASAP